MKFITTVKSFMFVEIIKVILTSIVAILANICVAFTILANMEEENPSKRALYGIIISLSSIVFIVMIWLIVKRKKSQ